LAGSVVAALAAALAAAGPAFASCECDIVSHCKWFSIAWQDTCPTASSSELEKTLNDVQRRQLLERMAHGIAFASQAWQLVQNNPDLRAKLGRKPAALVHSGSNQVDRAANRGHPPSVWPSDSVLTRFRRADMTSVATLYTIRLGSYGSQQAAQTALLKWQDTVLKSAPRDSLLAVTWYYQSCVSAAAPGLFILLPTVTTSGQFDLCFRLLIDARDAERIAKPLEPRLMTHVEVVPVSVTAGVLALSLMR
jgi:hypothetical protein